MKLTLPDMSRIESITFIQEQDSCENSDSDYQRLTIELDDAGGGHFTRISTDRWSCDDPEQFATLLKQLTASADEWSEGMAKRNER